jgi:hypothetical protein
MLMAILAITFSMGSNFSPPARGATVTKTILVQKNVIVVDSAAQQSLVNLDSLAVSIPVIVQELKEAKLNKPANGSSPLNYIYWILGVLAVLYDQVVRFVPTVRNYTLTHILELFLGIFSKVFTGSPNNAVLADGSPGTFKSTIVIPGSDTPAPS